MAPNLLILGGTAEASALATAVAETGWPATFSYAGRVARPVAQPLPVRMGGFGGVEGLASYMTERGITHLVDATHPFAATISRNAILAAKETGTPLAALTRPPWAPAPGDAWTRVADMEAAVQHLEDVEKSRVFLAIGRTEIDRFSAAPEHFYLLRLVEAPDTPPALPNHQIVTARGPFDAASDQALLERHGIELVVSKNSGGSGARAKLDAARALGLPVLMIDRPELPSRVEFGSVDAVLEWISHTGTPRGV